MEEFSRISQPYDTPKPSHRQSSENPVILTFLFNHALSIPEIPLPKTDTVDCDRAIPQAALWSRGCFLQQQGHPFAKFGIGIGQPQELDIFLPSQACCLDKSDRGCFNFPLNSQ